MSDEKSGRAFYVGYLDVPGPLRGFLLIAAAALIAGFAGFAYGIATTQDNPGTGRFLSKLGLQKMTGVMELEPYPIVRVPPSEGYPKGRTVMLSGPGKRGVQPWAKDLGGVVVDVGGILIRRGTIDMLRVRKKADLGKTKDPVAGVALLETPFEAESLGRWRLAGEICDGKCYVGAMRPGRGLAHKACANFCITGGIPPVFVSAGSVEGVQFFLLADEEGGRLPDTMFDLVGLTIEIDGEIERRGDLLVFKVDLESARKL